MVEAARGPHVSGSTCECCGRTVGEQGWDSVDTNCDNRRCAAWVTLAAWHRLCATCAGFLDVRGPHDGRFFSPYIRVRCPTTVSDAERAMLALRVRAC